MYKSIGLIAVVFCTLGARAQTDSVAMHYAGMITEADLRKHLEILASDAYEGRETGFKGQKMAADYLVQQFRSFGIPPVPDAQGRGMLDGYQQQFALEFKRPGGVGMTLEGRKPEFMQDFFYFSEKLKGACDPERLAITTDKGLATLPEGFTSEVVLVLDGGTSTEGAGSVPGPRLFQRLAAMNTAASSMHARVLLMVSNDAQALMKDLGHYINSPRMRLAGTEKEEAEGPQVIIVDRPLAEALLTQGGTTWKKVVKKANKRPMIVPTTVAFNRTSRTEQLFGENVLAFIEGGAKKEEVVVVTAHYDHIGVSEGEVYNGADDDGSGTVALLEMAEAFAKAKAEGHGPLRSVLFMPVSGEEKGLLGSEYYSEHPVFPLENTVADVNIDMIGRVDSIHERSAPYVYIIGSDRLSSDLHTANETANAYSKLELDYRFNAEDDPNRFYYRSDHYNFAKHGIPSIFYFSGVHADYHGPHDEVDRIRFDLLRQRTLLVFHTAWELANRAQRPAVDKPKKAQ
jgi:hypothetical protein